MGLDVKVDISAADIEAQVVQAIAASAFGNKLKEAVEDALKSLGNRYTYDSELKKWVEQKMRAIVFEYVEKNCTAQIEESIKAWITSEKLTEITNQVIGTVVSKLTTESRY
jgi:uncharacterized membrane-anchored protein YjiN (DUF445 family)